MRHSLTYVVIFHRCKVSDIVFVSLMFVNTVLMTLNADFATWRHRWVERCNQWSTARISIRPSLTHRLSHRL